ncbi:MAG TPA: hypothetical protein VMM77_07905 [Gemmatimonadaceae bacterium]|nr:hypothetical protein [Gemmatimonadaceae bacterium]
MGTAQGAGETQAQTAASATLARELSDFLVLLSISLNKHSFYPSGHPQLAGASAELLESLRTLLVERTTLALGVARQQLVIEGVATDCTHPLLADLADRLHRHSIGAIQFSSGVGEDDVCNFLTVLSEDPDRSEQPLGLNEDPSAGLGHIRVHPVNFSRLTLLEGDQKDIASGGIGTDLWIGLARAALESDQPASGDERALDPVALATAIDGHEREVAYDQVIVGYLLQISDELRSGLTPESAALRQRVSRLISSLRPETLSRLLEMGGNTVQRRRFLLDASQGVAVDAVVELVEAAALASGQTISHAMARLLHKLAAQASGAGKSLSPADGALRQQVRRLVRGWTLADPNPDEYRKMLDRMARASPDVAKSSDAEVSEAERILAMSLELEVIEEPTLRALRDLVEQGRVHRVVALLDSASPGSACVVGLWGELSSAKQMAALLASEPLDSALLERLVTGGGAVCVEPLLDALASSPSRATRRLVLEHLISIGLPAAQAAVLRLTDAPWYVRRNILTLVRRTGVMPEGWSPADQAQHPDARVRREAVRLMVEHPAWRERAIVFGLLDTDAAVLRMALSAAAASCPKPAVAPMIRLLQEGTLDDEQAPLAIRALAASGTREGLELALNSALERTIFGRRKLAPLTDDLLAAISSLAIHWSKEPQTATVLALALAHNDPRVRAAARPEA